MNVQPAHGGLERAEHHACVVLEPPIESNTYFPNGLSSPLTSSGLIEFLRARAAESWSAGGWLTASG
jgi:hypothetical protein